MNLDKFRAADLRRPTQEVELPELRGFLFDEQEKPVLLIRGLDFNEQFQAREELKSAPVAEAMKEAIEKAFNGNQKPLVDETAKLVNAPLNSKPIAQTIYRVALILRGTIKEDGTHLFQRQDVVKLYKHFPTSFEKLSDAINTLSGEPSRLGESQNAITQMNQSALQ